MERFQRDELVLPNIDSKPKRIFLLTDIVIDGGPRNVRQYIISLNAFKKLKIIFNH